MRAMKPHDLLQFQAGRFDQQHAVLSLWQELAEHFYPERAHFLLQHFVGEELADSLASSQPVLIRRDLGNSLDAMLRDGEWFKISVEGEPDHEGKKWLEWASAKMLRLMNHRQAGFRRATKEGDHDYVTFGNLVMGIEMNRKYTGVQYRTHDMGTTAWWDNEQGEVDGLCRKWRPKLFEAANYFGLENLHGDYQRQMMKEKGAFQEVEFIHFDMTSEMYGHGEYERYPRVSCWLDTKHEHLTECLGSPNPQYIVPRFQTIAGSPYAYSPATVVGLPDARTLQAMTHTLLEAGERHARPPIIATENVIRGDANFYPDGVTFINEDYDQRTGAAVTPLIQDAKGFPFGMDMREGIVEVLQSAFYINKLGLPETDREMTAYEVQERMKQYRRENLPLFAPIEHEYSGRLCEVTFDLLFRNGFFGSPQDIPRSLMGRDIQFKFESPLSAAEEELKVQQFRQVASLLAETAEIDPYLKEHTDFGTAFRDAVEGGGAPVKWLRDVDEAQRQIDQRQQNDMAMAAQEAAA